MTTAAFNTLAAARRMEQAGLSREAAEAVAETAREAAGEGRDALVTKADLDARLEKLEARLIWRVVGIVFAGNALMAALIGGLLVAVLDRLP